MFQLSRVTVHCTASVSESWNLNIWIDQAERSIIVGIALFSATLSSHAQGLLEMPPEVRALHLNSVFPSVAGHKLDDYRLALQDLFYRFDATGDGLLTAEDPVFFTIVQRTRAGGGKRPWVMEHDFSGDGVVTESEIRRGVAFDLRYYKRGSARELSDQLEKTVAEAMAADTDHDGRITLVEAAKLREGSSFAELEDNVTRLRYALWAGIGSIKGAISYESFVLEGENWFRAADADNDGFVSQEEYSGRQDNISRAIQTLLPK
jgi:hypothetical protein